MSHFSEVKTELTNRKFILKALEQMGYTTEENLAGVEVRGFQDNKSQADFKALTSTHYDIGFKKSATGGYEIVSDWEILTKITGTTNEAFSQQLKREYAKAAILEMAKERGLEVEYKENKEDLSMELVVTQW